MVQGFSGRPQLAQHPLTPQKSHPKHPEPRLLRGRVPRRRQAQPHHPPGVGRVDDAVVPEPRARVIGGPLLVVAGGDGGLEGGGVGGRPLLAGARPLVLLHLWGGLVCFGGWLLDAVWFVATEDAAAITADGSTSRPTCASTLAACSPPMTLMRELGHVNMKSGL
jgi:hypothetical protein